MAPIGEYQFNICLLKSGNKALSKRAAQQRITQLELDKKQAKYKLLFYYCKI